jgi:hypothetical protein
MGREGRKGNVVCVVCGVGTGVGTGLVTGVGSGLVMGVGTGVGSGVVTGGVTGGGRANLRELRGHVSYLQSFSKCPLSRIVFNVSWPTGYYSYHTIYLYVYIYPVL